MALRERILIIGNGFDLYHELPTKYSQFIKVLINIEKLNLDDDNDITFEDLFKDVERYSEMKIRFNTESMNFNKAKISEIKNIISRNGWFWSFKSKLHFENWIDVENEIKDILIIFNSITNSIKNILANNFIKEIYINEAFEGPTSLKFNEEYFQLGNFFGLILIDDNDEKINKDYFSVINNYLIKFKSDNFFDFLFLNLKEFMNVFNIYLNDLVNLFYDNIDSEYSNSLAKIHTKINKFYTFNYTPTLENFYNISDVSYLHGKYNFENNNIVLGIDEVDEELQNDKIFMFTKYYQKLFNDTDYIFLSEMKSTSKYDGLDKDFILFGHSLADNDQNYIKELFSVTLQRENNTITILFYSLSDKAQKLKNLLKIIGREDIEFLMKLKRLIFVEINDNPFETVFNLLPKSYSSSTAPESY